MMVVIPPRAFQRRLSSGNGQRALISPLIQSMPTYSYTPFSLFAAYMRPVAAETTGTMMSVLSTWVLVHAFSKACVEGFQVNFSIPSGAGRVMPPVKAFPGPAGKGLG